MRDVALIAAYADHRRLGVLDANGRVGQHVHCAKGLEHVDGDRLGRGAIGDAKLWCAGGAQCLGRDGQATPGVDGIGHRGGNRTQCEGVGAKGDSGVALEVAPVNAVLEVVIELDVQNLRLNQDLAPQHGLVVGNLLADRGHLRWATLDIQGAGGLVENIARAIGVAAHGGGFLALFLQPRICLVIDHGLEQNLDLAEGVHVVGVTTANVEATANAGLRRIATTAATTGLVGTHYITAGIEVGSDGGLQEVQAEHALLVLADHQHTALDAAIHIQIFQHLVKHLAGGHVAQGERDGPGLLAQDGWQDQVELCLVGNGLEDKTHIGVVHFQGHIDCVQRVEHGLGRLHRSSTGLLELFQQVRLNLGKLVRLYGEPVGQQLLRLMVDRHHFLLVQRRRTQRTTARYEAADSQGQDRRLGQAGPHSG